MTNVAIKQLIAQGVADALAEIKANRSSRNGDDSHDSGTGSRRTERAARECPYGDFLKCQPLNFKGTKGFVSLTQWFKKMESVFYISNCTVACQIKFATCTLLGSALIWWNFYLKTVGHDAAYGMPQKTMEKMMSREVCRWTSRHDSGNCDGIQAKKMQDASEFATELMDQKICTFAERQAENKRKLDNDNQAQQQPPKKKNVARA
uniref:Reverse transcriptase domain-containing protein n=1 Tax=Tanacetum cinerariifolium TaxID=118510 RepID=A0A6L2JQW9_TANCI|nr:hypothetical protein [Tanacetum cinerariifolium]